MDAKRYDKRNTAYENILLSNYQVRTQEDQGFLNKFKDYMRNKWNAVGYKGDVDYINQFWETHPMPRTSSKTLPVPEHR